MRFLIGGRLNFGLSCTQSPTPAEEFPHGASAGVRNDSARNRTAVLQAVNPFFPLAFSE